MKSVPRLLICFIAGLLANLCAAADDPPEKEPAAPIAPEARRAANPALWSSISYPAMTPWRDWITFPKLLPTILVENKGKDGMTVTLNYFLPSAAEQRRTGKREPEPVTAWLYLNDGLSRNLKGTTTSGAYMGSGGPLKNRELQTSHVFTIPWGPNTLDEAWVRFDLKDRNFWVELPYGFTRNPADPSPPEDPKRRRPVSIPCKSGAPKREDLAIPWEYVSYRLEKIAQRELVTVHMANALDAMLEFKLSTTNVREPECSLTAAMLPGIDRSAKCISLILDNSARECSQMFRIFQCPDDLRRLCSVEVTIAGEQRKLSVPSSLLFNGHGHVSLIGCPRSVEIPAKWQ